MTDRIHFSEFERLLSDDNTPDATLTRFLKPAALCALPLAPILTVDERTVELPPNRGILGLSVKSLNDRANRKRLAAYETRIMGGWKGLRLLAEGDSWFLYPILLKDVIDNLSNDYAIYSVAAAGDTLENMMRGTTQLEALIAEHKFNGLLLSAGGNDIAGDMLRSYLTVQPPPAKQAASYLGNNLDAFLANTQQKLDGLFGGLTTRFPDLKIFCHGYDWPFPRTGGLWLAPALIAQQVPGAVQAGVLKVMIDRYYQMLGNLADKYRDKVHIVDCRGSIGESMHWFDELHPLNPGYTRVADRFRNLINKCYGISAARGAGDRGAKITWYPNKQAKAGVRGSGEFQPGSAVTIGRSADSNIVLTDDRVSRNHARLEIKDGEVVFTDLNTTNGSLLDGRRRVGATTWRAGQKLQIGDHLFELAFAHFEPVTLVSPLVETSESGDQDAAALNRAPAKHPLDDYEATRELGQSSGVEEGPRERRAGEVRIAKALDVLRAEINRLAPNRKKSSDGWVGDASHQSRASDHNPWVRDQGAGVVTALDITHDPTHGCDAGALAETLRSGKDARIKYIIWNRRIANSAAIGGKPAWEWRPYSGANPHDHHFHISVKAEKASYDSEAPWLEASPPPAVS